MAGVGPVENRKKQARWRRIVRGQAGSGLSVRAYCAQQGVKESAYYWWRAQLARRDATTLAAAFVPVQVAAEEPTRGAGGRAHLMLPQGKGCLLFRKPLLHSKVS